MDIIRDKITKDKLKRYLSITKEALEKARSAITDDKRAEDFLDMAERYYSDAGFFFKKGDYIDAFAAINYAHGWLDAGARIRLFEVNDSRLFTVDNDL